MTKFGEQYRSDNSNVSGADSKTAAADKMNETAAGTKTLQVQPALKTKAKWPQQVKAAKSQWGKLSEAEILKSDGDPAQLSDLVQLRYAIKPDVADKQVKVFLDKCRQA